MRIIEADQHGVYDITDLPRSRPVRSPVEPDPLAPPTVKIPRFRMHDETFATTGDDFRRQLLIDQMMAAHIRRSGPGGFVAFTTSTS